MPYVPSFFSINQKLVFTRENGEPWVKLQYEEFENVLRNMLRAIDLDEAWYRETYPDVDAAIKAGDLPNAREHFIASGYFEGRLPGDFEVDEAWYFTTYPDIAEAHARGEVASAKQHFVEFGYAEGRLPRA